MAYRSSLCLARKTNTPLLYKATLDVCQLAIMRFKGCTVNYLLCAALPEILTFEKKTGMLQMKNPTDEQSHNKTPLL